MLAKMAQNKRRQAYSVVWVQLMTAATCSVYWLIQGEWGSAASLILGALVSILPQVIFINRLFTEIAPTAVRRTLRRFYVAELLKFGIIGLLFISILKWTPIVAMPFIIGIIVTQMAMLVAPFIVYCIGFPPSREVRIEAEERVNIE